MTTSSDISNLNAADITSDTVDALIAKLTASYQQPTTAQVMVKVSKPSKLAAVKAAKVSEPVVSGMDRAIGSKLVTTIALPEKGSLSPREYFIAMRNARDLNDRIRAVAGYAGFNPAESYSSQELSANLSARRTLNPPKGQPLTSGAGVSLRGFVAGMPDHAAKKLADLQGRSVYTTEMMLDNERQAREALARGDQESAARFATMARVERERLNQIQADLAAL